MALLFTRCDLGYAASVPQFPHHENGCDKIFCLRAHLRIKCIKIYKIGQCLD